MGNLSRLLPVAAAGALIVGCGTTDQRYGKGNDHEVANLNNRTVFVEREPRVVYYQPAPVYSTTPVYGTRVVPVTRYYYYPTPAN